MKAKAAMTREILCLEADDTLTEAYAIMQEREIRHIPIIDGQRLIGILSDRDVLRFANVEPTGLDVPPYPVEIAMTAKPLTCSPETELSVIGNAMITHKIDCLPVVDASGDLVGLVTSSDLIEMLIAKEPAAASAPVPFRYKVLMGLDRTAAAR